MVRSQSHANLQILIVPEPHPATRSLLDKGQSKIQKGQDAKLAAITNGLEVTVESLASFLQHRVDKIVLRRQ